MPPQENVELEALVQQSLSQSETLSSIDANAEALLTEQMKTTQAVEGLEPALEAIMLNTKKEERPEVQKVELMGAEIVTIKGQKGDDGYSPVKGKDYWTDEDKGVVIEEASKKATPIKGKDYFTPTDISDFKKSVTPQKGKDYFDGKDGAVRVFTSRPKNPQPGDIWIRN
jgi:hypothetical protein